MKNTLILAALSAAIGANAAPVLIYSSSFEEPAFSATYTPTTDVQPGFLGGQGAVAGAISNRPWGTPTFSASALGQFSIATGTAANGNQAVVFDCDTYDGTSDLAIRPIDSTQSPSSNVQGINSGIVVLRAKAWFNNDPRGNSAFGIGAGEFPGTSINFPTSEFGSLVIGGNSRVYLRTGQATSLGTNLRLSNLPALAAQTWHDLTLVFIPTSRSVFAFVNGQTAFGTASSPTGVTAAATASNGSPVNQDIGQFRLPLHGFGAFATPVGVGGNGGWNKNVIDDFDAYKLESNSVMVNAVLEGYAGSTEGRSVDVQLRPNGTPGLNQATSFFTQNTVIASAPIAGNYDVWVKPKGALASLINSVDVRLFGTYFLNTNHTIGDIDGDNEIGPGDFELVVAEFGGVNPDADIDGDGEVGPGDFEIVVANFGTAGTP